MNDQERYKRAQQRVKALRGFYVGVSACACTDDHLRG
jgi:hypothetical protein